MLAEKQIPTTSEEMAQGEQEFKDVKIEEVPAPQSFDATDKKLIKDKLKEPFSYDKLIHLMQTVQNPEFKIPVLVELLFEWTRMFKTMGKFMSAAFSDISSKAVVIGKNHQQFYSKQKYIIDIVKIEKQSGITRLNGENSKKQGFKDKKSPHYKYISTSRTIVRITWLFHFITLLMENLINDSGKKLSKCAKEAYSVALAPHHPSIVRTGASIALSAAPKRQKFMKTILGGEFSEQVGKQSLEKIRDLIKPLYLAFNEILEKNELSSLP